MKTKTIVLSLVIWFAAMGVWTVFEPGIELMTKIGDRWWIGLNGSYRNTSPVKLTATNELLFNKFNGGLSVRYGIF